MIATAHHFDSLPDLSTRTKRVRIRHHHHPLITSISDSFALCNGQPRSSNDVRNPPIPRSINRAAVSKSLTRVFSSWFTSLALNSDHCTLLTRHSTCTSSFPPAISLAQSAQSACTLFYLHVYIASIGCLIFHTRSPSPLSTLSFPPRSLPHLFLSILHSRIRALCPNQTKWPRSIPC